MAQIPNTAARLMVLVDGENIPAKHADALLRQVNALGTVVEVRVYGHRQKMSGWRDVIKAHSLTEVDVAIEGPNSADFRLTIEAMDILHTRAPDAFCIVSSDRGFSELAARIRSSAIRSYGFGEKKAKREYRDCFDVFFEMSGAKRSNGARQATPAPPKTPAANQRKGTEESATSGRQSVAPKGPTSPARSTQKSPTAKATQPQRTGSQAVPSKPPLPVAKILEAVDASAAADGWSHQGTVGNRLRASISDFSPRNYGYNTMSRLVAAVPDLVSETRPGKGTFIRRKPAAGRG